MNSNARVKSVESRVVKVPLDRPIGTKNVHFSITYFVLIRVTDEDGVAGNGGLWCLRPDLPPLLEATCQFMARQVIGKSTTEPGVNSAALESASGFIGRKGLSVFGTAPIKMALEDIVCRRLGVSLAELLGKVKSRIPAYKTGLFLNMDMETLVSEARLANEEGFRAMKMWLGSVDLREDLERVAAVREVLDPDTKLMFDVAQSWNLPEAMRALDHLTQFNPHWIEDPVPHRDAISLQRVVTQSPVPIATGENAYLPESFRELLEAGVQYLEPDLQRLGGVREWPQLVAMAAPYGATIVPHCYHNVALQLAAATQQMESWIEYVPWWQIIFEEDFKIIDGMIDVPTGPGIGWNLDKNVVDDLALSEWHVLAEA
jgi:L-alanine-DL-glutamate epimerase-like enolase superfamily enzyme